MKKNYFFSFSTRFLNYAAWPPQKFFSSRFFKSYNWNQRLLKLWKNSFFFNFLAFTFNARVLSGFSKNYNYHQRLNCGKILFVFNFQDVHFLTQLDQPKSFLYILQKLRTITINADDLTKHYYSLRLKLVLPIFRFYNKKLSQGNWGKRTKPTYIR